jgi:hypothetical protein
MLGLYSFWIFQSKKPNIQAGAALDLLIGESEIKYLDQAGIKSRRIQRGDIAVHFKRVSAVEGVQFPACIFENNSDRPRHLKQ